MFLKVSVIRELTVDTVLLSMHMESLSSSVKIFILYVQCKKCKFTTEKGGLKISAHRIRT
jgi:hypothetical protein